MQGGSKSRPTGITILAVLALIGGIFSILSGLALIGLGGFAAGVLPGSGLGGLAMIWGLITLALGAVELALAFGFWSLAPWAWTVGIAVQVASIVIGLVMIVTNYSTISGQIVSWAISAIIIYYLFQPSIRTLFGR